MISVAFLKKVKNWLNSQPSDQPTNRQTNKDGINFIYQIQVSLCVCERVGECLIIFLQQIEINTRYEKVMQL